MPNDDGVHRTEQMETNTIPNREFFCTNQDWRATGLENLV